jgi:Ser/Thr protein kinase RdoA (MazF antagonist)
MTHFPVTNSNLSAVHLGQFLKEIFTINGDVTCSLIKAGINDTYLVTSKNDQFVFRVYSLNWRTKSEIEEEIKLLNELKHCKISVSTPIVDKKGQCIQTLKAPEGERWGVLFTYAKGQKLHLYSKKTHFEIGQLMGRLHAVTINKKLNRVDYSPQVKASSSV